MVKLPANMKTCKTCKYWVKEHDEFRNFDQEGRVQVQLYCGHPKIAYQDSPELDGASYMDGEGLAACFVTGPDFGCIHHTSSSIEYE